jgi:hypothetical protein
MTRERIGLSVQELTGYTRDPQFFPHFSLHCLCRLLLALHESTR